MLEGLQLMSCVRVGTHWWLKSQSIRGDFLWCPLLSGCWANPRHESGSPQIAELIPQRSLLGLLAGRATTGLRWPWGPRPQGVSAFLMPTFAKLPCLQWGAPTFLHGCVPSGQRHCALLSPENTCLALCSTVRRGSTQPHEVEYETQVSDASSMSLNPSCSSQHPPRALLREGLGSHPLSVYCAHCQFRSWLFLSAQRADPCPLFFQLPTFCHYYCLSFSLSCEFMPVKNISHYV